MNIKRIILTITAILLISMPAVAGEKATAFEQVMDHYESIRSALLHDSAKGVATHAKEIESIVLKAGAKFDPAAVGVTGSKQECMTLLDEIASSASKLAQAKGLTDAREIFGELSKPMVRFREMASGDKPMVVYCSMAKKSWLQPEGQVGNPYLGQKMAECGEVVSK